MSAQPARLRLRTYAAGTGTCLLLTVFYAPHGGRGRGARDRRQRHLLIDYGIPSADSGGNALAPLIAEHCDGTLDATLFTRRHPAHCGGLDDEATRGALQQLHPGRLLCPSVDPAQRGPDQLAELAFGWTTQIRGPGAVDVSAALPGVDIRVVVPFDPWREANHVVAEPAGLGAAATLTQALTQRSLSPRFPESSAEQRRRAPALTLVVTVGARVILLAGTARAKDWARVLAPDDVADPALVTALSHADIVHVPATEVPNKTALDPLLPSWSGQRRTQFVVTGEPDAGLEPGLAALGKIGRVIRTSTLPVGMRWFDLSAGAASTAKFRYAKDPARG